MIADVFQVICGISAGLDDYGVSYRHDQIEKDRTGRAWRPGIDTPIGGPAYIYDPNILDDKDLVWTGTLHLLGYNQYATGSNKAFVSGPGTYQGWGRSSVRTNSGNDPNEPEDSRQYFVNDHCLSERNQTSAYPLHWSCLVLLTRALHGSNDIALLNKDALFEAFTNCDGMARIAFSLSQEPFWQSCNLYWTVKPEFGSEFAFCDPARSYNSQLHLKVDNFRRSAPGTPSKVDFRQSIRKDVFALLTIDVLYQVTTYLDHDDLISCIQASWYVYLYTSHNEFWARRIRSHLKWFWELRDLTYDNDSKDIDWKKLYLWAIAVATPRQWMTGPFMNLASRQRIWTVCEKLTEAYAAAKSSNNLITLGPEAWLKLNKSQKLYTPRLSHRRIPEQLGNISTLWLHTWHELSEEGTELAAYWDHGHLTGIELVINGNSRLHGQSSETSRESERFTCCLNSGDWIKGMILHVNANEHEEQDRPELQVEAVTILMSSGESRTLREERLSNPQLCKIPLLLEPKHTLVGVTGKLYRGRIASLGLMQCKHPRMNTGFAWFTTDFNVGQEFSLRPYIQTGLFKSDLQSTLGYPIWSDTNFEVTRAPGSLHAWPWRRGEVWVDDELVYDLALWHDVMFGQNQHPQHMLLLAANEDELLKITNLYFYVPPSEEFTGQKHKEAETGSAIATVFSIAGAAVEFIDGLGTKTRRFIDSGPHTRVPVSRLMWPTDDSAPTWEAEYTHSFAIGGPMGERLHDIEVSTRGEHKTVKLNTSFGRSISFANASSGAASMTWTTISSKDRFIAGLVFVFGRMGGYDPMTRKRHFHHRQLADISLLTLPLAESNSIEAASTVG